MSFETEYSFFKIKSKWDSQLMDYKIQVFVYNTCIFEQALGLSIGLPIRIGFNGMNISLRFYYKDGSLLLDLGFKLPFLSEKKVTLILLKIIPNSKL